MELNGIECCVGMSACCCLIARVCEGAPPPPLVQATPICDSAPGADCTVRGPSEIPEGDDHRRSMAKQRLCPSNTRRGFRHCWTMDFRGAFSNWSYCVPWVLSATLVFRCMMFMFCVKEADWCMMALVAYFAVGFRTSTPCLLACTMHSVTCKQPLVQATLGVGFVNFWSFTVAWTRGGGDRNRGWSSVSGAQQSSPPLIAQSPTLHHENHGTWAPRAPEIVFEKKYRRCKYQKTMDVSSSPRSPESDHRITCFGAVFLGNTAFAKPGVEISPRKSKQ